MKISNEEVISTQLKESLLEKTELPSIHAKQKMKALFFIIAPLIAACVSLRDFSSNLLMLIVLVIAIISINLIKIYIESLKLDANDELLRSVREVITTHEMVTTQIGTNYYCEGIIVVDQTNDKLLINNDYINTDALIEAKLQYQSIFFKIQNNLSIQHVAFNSEKEALDFFILFKKYIIDFKNKNINPNFKPALKDERLEPAISLFDKYNAFMLVPLFFPIFHEMMYQFEVTSYLNFISYIGDPSGIVFSILCSFVYLLCFKFDEDLLVSKGIINKIDGKIWVLILPAISFYLRSKKLRQFPIYAILSLSSTIYIVIAALQA